MAILKLLGFDSVGVIRLVLAETVIIAVAGALIGIAFVAAVLLLGRPAISVEGYTIAPIMTQQVLLAGLVAGTALGYLGALVAARSGARLPIVQALKEVD
jgi:ABC-type antimicrobial peptide transport system permease subunit